MTVTGTSFFPNRKSIISSAPKPNFLPLLSLAGFQRGILLTMRNASASSKSLASLFSIDADFTILASTILTQPNDEMASDSPIVDKDSP